MPYLEPLAIAIVGGAIGGVVSGLILASILRQRSKILHVYEKSYNLQRQTLELHIEVSKSDDVKLGGFRAGSRKNDLKKKRSLVGFSDRRAGGGKTNVFFVSFQMLPSELKYIWLQDTNGKWRRSKIKLRPLSEHH